jgi:hypothetical protein
MRTMRLITLIFITCLYCGISYAQAAEQLALAQLRKDIIAHSPEAEAMGKYAVLPLTMYTGTPDISVPIYEIKTPGLDLPFSLSYNYNGYKPNDVPGWAGMGWSVQGIGSIVRIVKGEVDESMATGTHYDDYINISMLTWNQPFLALAAIQGVDTQPDIYIFNVGGYSGKFIMIKNKAYLFPHQHLQITRYGTGFKIIDDKGITYIFNNTETTFHKTIAGTVPVPTHISAWYVSQIISADNKDVVNFGYTTYTYKQPDTFSDTYTINNQISGTGGHSEAIIYNYGDHITALLPSSVTSKYGNIYFTQSATDRQDLSGSTGGKMLDAINVSNPGSNFGKTIFLNHEYFGSGTNTRLKLKSLSIQQVYPVASTTSYHFDYYLETSSLPDISDKGIDFWGYYNGASNIMLFPSTTFSPSLYPYADRSANISRSQLGMLKQITYPTGGYSVLEYEQNQAGHYYATYKNSATTLDNVVNYSSTNQTDGVTTIRKNFTIGVTQVVRLTTMMWHDGIDFPSIPILHLYDNLNNELYVSPLLTSGLDIIFFSTQLTPGDYHFTVSCPSTAQATEGKLDYLATVPDVVDNTLSDGPGLRVKKITSFDNSITPAKIASIRQYFYNEGSLITNRGITGSSILNNCSQSHVTNYQASIAGPLSDLAANQFYYMKVTEQTQDASRTGTTNYSFAAQGESLVDVKPISKIDYKYSATGFLPVKSITYQYQNIFKRVFNCYSVKKITNIGSPAPGCSPCFCPLLASPDNTQPADLNDIYQATDFYDLPSGYTQTTSTLETQYDNAGQPALQHQTNYFYDNTDETYPTRTVTKNSQGQDITSSLKYPLDYQIGGCQTLTTMDNAFTTDLNNAKNTLSNSLAALQTALAPYQPYHGNTAANQSSFTAIANGYHIQTDYRNNVATAITNRDNAWNNYLTCTDAAIAGTSIGWQKGLLTLRKNNVLNQPVENYISIHKENGNDYLLGATRNESGIFTSGSAQIALPVAVSQVESDETILNSSFLSSPDNYYKAQLLFGYDSKLNLSSQKKNNDVNQGYLWNYQNVFPVAQIVNADVSEVAYTSFEADDNGGWTFSGTKNPDASAPTGANSYTLNGTNNITRTGLSSTTNFIVSYWTKNAVPFTITGTMAGYPIKGRSYGGWTYYEHKISGQTQVIISGSGLIDELRLYPDRAQMTTYTYEPLMGMTSQCDMNSKIIYYQYDGLARLKEVRDQDGNLVKTIEYHFQNP